MTVTEATMTAVAAGMIATAAGLVALNPASRATRAFAVLLVLRAVSTFTSSMSSGPPDFWFRSFLYFILVIPFATLYFASLFPRPRSWGRPARIIAVVGAGATIGAYLYDPSLLLHAGPFAPLVIIGQAWPAAYAAAAALFLVDYVRAPPGPRRAAPLLVATGFLIVVLFDAGAPSQSEMLAVERLSRLVGLLVFAGLVAYSLRLGRAEPAPALWRVVLASAVALAAGASLAFVPSHLQEVAGVAGAAASRLAMPALVAYGLLRHQLFDVDLKVRWGIRHSTIAASFVALFFVVSEIAAALLSQEIGPYLGIAAAGVLVFALAPLQHLGDRVARAVVPPPNEDRLDPAVAARVYAEEARRAWADGTLDRSERATLDRLRDTLGLSREEASRLEEDAARLPVAP